MNTMNTLKSSSLSSMTDSTGSFNEMGGAEELGTGGMEANAGTLMDPLGAVGNAIFGDSFLKYIFMPHLILTDALSGDLASSSGTNTLLGSAGSSSGSSSS